jgi:glucokinase
MMFKATGGVFIAGGVAMGLGPLLDGATFRAAFESHPPYQKLLSAIPTSVVACRQPGLVGCAAFVEQMLRTGARQDIIIG